MRGARGCDENYQFLVGIYLAKNMNRISNDTAGAKTNLLEPKLPDFKPTSSNYVAISKLIVPFHFSSLHDGHFIVTLNGFCPFYTLLVFV